MEGNEELLTIGRIDRALEKLSPHVRARVMAWLVAKHLPPPTQREVCKAVPLSQAKE